MQGFESRRRYEWSAHHRAKPELFGIEEREIAKPPEQFALFKEVESPPTAPANPADEVARTDLDVPPDDEDLPPGRG
jgi:hypothetical protein